MSRIKIKGAAAVPFMPGFQPLSALWEGDAAPYPSEFSARWAIRKLRPQLTQEGAVAMHRGRTLVHPERFSKAAERAGLEQFAKRSAPDLS